MTVSARRDLLVLACATSSGIHAALVPGHLAEGAAAGAAFAAASAALAAPAVALTLRPRSGLPPLAAALAFAGLLVAYGLATTIGIPLVHPEPEAVDGLALATKAVEATGLAAAWSLLRRRPRGTAATRPIPLPLVALVAAFGGLATLAGSGGHGGIHGDEGARPRAVHPVPPGTASTAGGAARSEAAVPAERARAR